jgi:hypothetical protein
MLRRTGLLSLGMRQRFFLDRLHEIVPVLVQDRVALLDTAPIAEKVAGRQYSGTEQDRGHEERSLSPYRRDMMRAWLSALIQSHNRSWYRAGGKVKVILKATRDWIFVTVVAVLIWLIWYHGNW